MAYAVIKTGGKQYKVSEGDVISVEKLGDLNEGDEATFADVLAVGDGSSVRVGTPTVSGASVTAEVIGQIRGKKVTAYKFKRRQGYHKTKGHRQHLTKVTIKAIAG